METQSGIKQATGDGPIKPSRSGTPKLDSCMASPAQIPEVCTTFKQTPIVQPPHLLERAEMTFESQQAGGVHWTCHAVGRLTHSPHLHIVRPRAHSH